MLRRYLHQIDLILLLILVVAAFLFFFRLDHRPFWQDEAETACLARNVLKYDVPKAFDGTNLVSQEESREFNGDYIWRWSPWLQIYITAGAFWLGGLTTTAGRLPFAFLGFACVPLVYLFIRKHFEDITWARVAAALLASSVIFLLFSRQCRYYSLGAFLTLLSLYAFRRNWQKRLGPAILLVVSLALLFYTNYLLFFSFAGGLLIAALWVYREELPLYRTLTVSLVIALLLIPGVGFYRIQQQTDMISLIRIPRHIACGLIDVFRFMLPLPVAIGMLWWFSRKTFRTRLAALKSEERFILFLSILILGNIFILSVSPGYFFRYLIHLFPVCVIILSWVICKVVEYRKWAGVAMLLLVGLTNWPYMIPFDLSTITRCPKQNDPYMLTSANIPLRLYLTELFDGYPDVNQGLINFFLTHAKPGDVILTNYDDLPIQFYTKCTVVGGLERPSISLKKLPDWVVKLKHYSYVGVTDSFIKTKLQLHKDYEAIKLPYPDNRFGNRPNPYYHHFIAPQKPYEHLIIYKKK